MAYPDTKRQEVRKHYVQGLPLETAASLSDVAYETARNWKRKAKAEGACWDQARQAKRISRGGIAELTGEIMESMVEQFAATMTAMKEAESMPPMQKAEILLKLSDAYVKTMAAAARGNPKLNRLSTAMEVVQLLGGFIAENFPDLRNRWPDISEGFGPEVIRNFGNGTA
jgi:uncharacterized protein YjcR